MSLIIILFLYLYTPPILPINITHILVVVGLIYLITKKENIIQLFKKSKLNIWLAIMLVAVFYLMILLTLTSKNYIFIINYILIIENIVVILFIYCYCKNNNISILKLLDYIIYAGLLQAIIAMMAFLFKDIQTFLVNIIIGNGYGYNGIIEKLVAHRMYGISTNLTFSTPILQSIIACIALWKMFYEKKYVYIIEITLLLFSAVINARTSIVIIGAGIICLILNVLDKENLRKLISIIIIITILMVGANNLFINNDNPTFKWINDGIEEIADFMQGESVGYFDTLNTFWTFPKGIDLISGTGNDIFGAKTQITSDVGFVNDLWIGGILLCIFIYTAIGYIIIKLNLYNKKMTQFLILFELIVFIVMNIKGTFVQPNNVINLFLLLFGIGNLYLTEEQKNEEKNRNIHIS